jgi:hypothetical protein
MAALAMAAPAMAAPTLTLLSVRENGIVHGRAGGELRGEDEEGCAAWAVSAGSRAHRAEPRAQFLKNIFHQAEPGLARVLLSLFEPSHEPARLGSIPPLATMPWDIARQATAELLSHQ